MTHRRLLVLALLFTGCEPDLAPRFERVIDQPFVCPQLTFSVTQLDFFVMEPRPPQIVHLTNPGPPVIARLVHPRPPFFVIEPQGPLMVPEGISQLQVGYQPQDARRHVGDLQVIVEGCAPWTVALNGSLSSLVVDPADVDFGRVDAGATASRFVSLHNSAPHAVVVENQIAELGFSVRPATVTLGPRQSTSLEVTARPMQAGNFTGQLQVVVENEIRAFSTFRVTTGAPRLRVETTSVTVPMLAPFGQSTTPTVRRVRLFNDGDVPLDDLLIEVSPPTMELSLVPALVPAGSSADLQIHFFPLMPLGPRQWTVRLTSNGQVFFITVGGEVALVPACADRVHVDRRIIRVGPPYPRVEPLVFTNVTGGPCVIDDLHFDRWEWLVEGGDQFPVPANASVTKNLVITGPGTSVLRFMLLNSTSGADQLVVEATP